VNGTPSVFINGTLFSPAKIPTYEELKKGIDDALAANDWLTRLAQTLFIQLSSTKGQHSGMAIITIIGQG